MRYTSSVLLFSLAAAAPLHPHQKRQQDGGSPLGSLGGDLGGLGGLGAGSSGTGISPQSGGTSAGGGLPGSGLGGAGGGISPASGGSGLPPGIFPSGGIPSGTISGFPFAPTASGAGLPGFGTGSSGGASPFGSSGASPFGSSGASPFGGESGSSPFSSGGEGEGGASPFPGGQSGGEGAGEDPLPFLHHHHPVISEPASAATPLPIPSSLLQPPSGSDGGEEGGIPTEKRQLSGLGSLGSSSTGSGLGSLTSSLGSLSSLGGSSSDDPLSSLGGGLSGGSDPLSSLSGGGLSSLEGGSGGLSSLEGGLSSLGGESGGLSSLSSIGGGLKEKRNAEPQLSGLGSLTGGSESSGLGSLTGGSGGSDPLSSLGSLTGSSTSSGLGALSSGGAGGLGGLLGGLGGSSTGSLGSLSSGFPGLGSSGASGLGGMTGGSLGSLTGSSAGASSSGAAGGLGGLLGGATGTSGGLGSLGSLTGVGGATPSNDVAGNTGCKDVTLIFARGTSESGTLGNIVGPSLASALISDSGSAAIQGVDYPASVEGNANLGADGGPTMAKLAQQALSQCPNSKIILGGYSQGGLVVHNALASQGLDGSKIAAVVAFGDPENGSSFTGVPSNKVVEVCGSSDPVCDFGPTNESGSHLSYTDDTSAVATKVLSIVGVSKAAGGAASSAAPAPNTSA